MNDPQAEAADELWRRCIKLRDRNRCVRCGEQYSLQAAHIFGRDAHRTRWALDNGLTLCLLCHAYFTDHPKDWEAFCIERLGDEAYWALSRRRHDVTISTKAIDAIESLCAFYDLWT